MRHVQPAYVLRAIVRWLRPKSLGGRGTKRLNRSCFRHHVVGFCLQLVACGNPKRLLPISICKVLLPSECCTAAAGILQVSEGIKGINSSLARPLARPFVSGASKRASLPFASFASCQLWDAERRRVHKNWRARRCFRSWVRKSVSHQAVQNLHPFATMVQPSLHTSTDNHCPAGKLVTILRGQQTIHCKRLAGYINASFARRRKLRRRSNLLLRRWELPIRSLHSLHAPYTPTLPRARHAASWRCSWPTSTRACGSCSVQTVGFNCFRMIRRETGCAESVGSFLALLCG